MFIYDNKFVLSFYSDVKCAAFNCPDEAHIHSVTFAITVYGLESLNDLDYLAIQDWISNLADESPLLPKEWTLEYLASEFYENFKILYLKSQLTHLVIKAYLTDIPCFIYILE